MMIKVLIQLKLREGAVAHQANQYQTLYKNSQGLSFRTLVLTWIPTGKLNLRHEELKIRGTYWKTHPPK